MKHTTPTIRSAGCALLVCGLLALALPDLANAHGPTAPIATSYIARIEHAPAGVQAKVVDGDQKMWLRVVAHVTVVVIDYRGVPYLRLSQNGVAVNRRSAMYYLNLVPSTAPPFDLSGPPDWQRVSGADEYTWHDGRLHALAAVALTPGTRYVGRWRIPLVLGSLPAAIGGGLWYSPAPSIVWFWPIAVLVLCMLAGWRLRRPRLDRLMARAISFAGLAAICAGTIGRELYGRPGVSAFQVIVLVLVLAFVAAATAWLVSGRIGFVSLLVIGAAALWAGLDFLPVLLHGFVLSAIPAGLMRVCTVVCLGVSVSVWWLGFNLGGQEDADAHGPADTGEVGGTTVALSR